MPDRPEAEPSSGPDEPGNEFAREDLAAFRLVAQAFGHHNRLAVEVPLVPDGLAGVETDPHLERRPRPTTVVLINAALHRHGAAERVDGAGEGNHEPVPQALHLLPSRRRHSITQQREVGAANLLRSVVPKASEQLGRRHEISEEQRYESGTSLAHAASLPVLENPRRSFLFWREQTPPSSEETPLFLTTLGELQARREAWRRSRRESNDQADGADKVDSREAGEPSTEWRYMGCGHANDGERFLAISAAGRVREMRRTAREELADQATGHDAMPIEQSDD